MADPNQDDAIRSPDGTPPSAPESDSFVAGDQETIIESQLSPEDREMLLRKRTLQVDMDDLESAGESRSPADIRREFLSRSTLSLESETKSPRKGDTARISLDPPTAKESHPSAGTGAADRPSAGGPPRRPPPRPLMARRGEAAAAAAPPVSPPPSTSAVAKSTAVLDEPAKSKTARIELPPDSAAAARSDGARSRTIKIKRAESPAPRRAAGKRAQVRTATPRAKKSSPTPPMGTLPSTFVVLSVLVMGVLIYILLAQTFAFELPFPGRR